MSVASVLDDVLDVASGALATEGRPVGRVVRFAGSPSWDCEMLAAWPSLRLGGFETNDATGPIRGGAYRPVLDVNLLLLRCVTALDAQGRVPDAATVDAEGEGFATDMQVLMFSIADAIANGTLLGSCSYARPRAVIPLTPLGALSGMSTVIEVSL